MTEDERRIGLEVLRAWYRDPEWALEGGLSKDDERDMQAALAKARELLAPKIDESALLAAIEHEMLTLPASGIVDQPHVRIAARVLSFLAAPPAQPEPRSVDKPARHVYWGVDIGSHDGDEPIVVEIAQAFDGTLTIRREWRGDDARREIARKEADHPMPPQPENLVVELMNEIQSHLAPAIVEGRALQRAANGVLALLDSLALLRAGVAAQPEPKVEPHAPATSAEVETPALNNLLEYCEATKGDFGELRPCRNSILAAFQEDLASATKALRERAEKAERERKVWCDNATEQKAEIEKLRGALASAERERASAVDAARATGERLMRDQNRAAEKMQTRIADLERQLAEAQRAVEHCERTRQELVVAVDDNGGVWNNGLCRCPKCERVTAALAAARAPAPAAAPEPVGERAERVGWALGTSAENAAAFVASVALRMTRPESVLGSAPYRVRIIAARATPADTAKGEK